MKTLIKITILLSFIITVINCGSNLPKEIETANKKEKNGDYKSAEKILIKAEQKYKKNYLFSLHLGLLYERNYKFLLKNKLKTVTINNPNFKPLGEAVMMKDRSGRILGYMLHDLTPVIKPLKRAVKKNPHCKEAYLAIGRMYAHMGKYQKAISELQNGLNNNKKDYRIPHLIAFIYDHNKEYKKAVTYYIISEKLNPDFSATYLNKALALFNLKDEKNAVKAMQKVIDINDNKKNTKNALLLVHKYYYKKHQFKKVIEWGEKNIDHFEDNPKLLTGLAKSYYFTENYKNAKKYLNKAFEYRKNDPLLLAILGQIELSSKNYKKAETFFLKSLKIKKTVQVLSQLGSLYLEKLSSPARAAVMLEKAIALSPNHYIALYQLALAYEKTNAPKEKQLNIWKKYIKAAKYIKTEKKFIKKAEFKIKKLK